MKTNKSYMKRLKVTKNGKVLGRAKGQQHPKSHMSSRRYRLAKKRSLPFHMTNKEKSRFLVNA